MSKASKQSGQKFDTGEIFADEEFDAEEFVEHMDDKGTTPPRPHANAHAHAHAKGGWRRLEELKEQKMLRNQLLELEDFEEF